MEVDVSKVTITPILESVKLEDIDDNTYFSEKYSDYISNSRLGLLKSKGVQAFFEGLKNQDFNGSFQLGSIVHQKILQPNDYELVSEVLSKPTAKAGLMADYLFEKKGILVDDNDIKEASNHCNYYKNKLTKNIILKFRDKAEQYWRDRYVFEKKNPPPTDKERIYIDKKTYNIASGCINAVSQNDDIQRLLNDEGIVNGCEKTILVDVQVNIPDYEPRVLKLKGKLDNFGIYDDRLVVNDLKTTSKPVSYFKIKEYNYHRELAMYAWLLNLVAKTKFDKNNLQLEGNFLVVGTDELFETKVFPMTNVLFQQGFNQFVYLLKTAAYFHIVEGYEF